MKRFTFLLTLLVAMVTTAMAQETIITSAELNAMTTSKKIAVRNLSGTNNYWLALTSNVQNLSSDAVLVWEPVTEGTAGTYYLKKAYADNSYVQAAASGAITLGAKETAQVFYTTLCSTSGSGETQFTGEALADGSDLNNLVRFVQNGATTWLNCRSSGENPILGNSGKGGWTVHNVYDMSDYYVLTISITKDDATTTTTSLVKAGTTITVPEYTGYTSDYTANETMPSSDKTITVTYTKESSEETVSLQPINIADNADAMLYSNAPCKVTTWGDQFTSWAVLFDGNTSTIFHSDYGTADTADGLDHYLRVDMGEGNEISEFAFTFTTRSKNCDVNSPTTIVVEGSNVADGEYTEIATLTGLPTTNSTVYESEILGNGNAYRYIRYRVTATQSMQKAAGHVFFFISEFGMSIPGEPMGPVAELEILIAEAEALLASSSIGTEVGCYSQETTDALSAAIATAKEKVNNATATADDITALETAMNGLTIVMPDASKVYMIQSAYPEYYNNQSVYKAIYNSNGSLRWANEDDADTKYMWKVVANGTGYVFQNCFDEQYVNGLSMSDVSYVTEVVHLGGVQFNIISNGQKWHTDGHYSGTGSEGAVVNWDGATDSPSAWSFVDVTDKYKAAITSTLQALVVEAQERCELVGTEVGEYTEESVIALEDAIAEAESVENATIEDIKALQAAMDALEVNMPDANKIYMIQSGLGAFYSEQGINKAIYNNGTSLSWGDADDTDLTQMWKFAATEGGYTLQSCSDNLYANGLSMSEEAATTTLNFIGVMQFNIVSDGATLHANNHGNGTGEGGNIISYKAGVNSASSWLLIDVTDKYDAAVEKAAIEAARAELRAAIEDARSQITYDETTVALSTEEGNGYITCPQEHGTINPTATDDNAGVIAMIDGNNSTYMHTAWKNTPEAPHYIQIDLGADATIEQFKFNTTNRSGCLNDFPKTYEIEGSNDGENFTAITTVTSTASSAGGSFESENIGERGVAYRYLRFKVTDCYPYYRTYFHLAEFTLTKVELKATEGNTGWFALIQEGMAADNEDATVESLTAATTKLVTSIEKGKAMTALKNAYNEFMAINIGNELGQYNGNEETINLTIANVEDILSRRDEELADTENSTIEEATEAIATLKTTLVYNMPITNGYYRFESYTFSGDYMLCDPSTIEGKTNRLAMGAGDDASSIFYLGTDNTLSSYEIGRYLPKAVAGGDWTCTAIGTEGQATTFGKGTAEGTYGFYIGDDASRAYHSGTKSWVNAGGAMTTGDGYAWVIEKVTSLPVTVTSAGYATFYAPVAVTIPAGVKVYYIKETSNNFAILAEVTEAIPANTGVILVAEAGTYDFEITEDEVAALEGNKLQGTAVSTIITKETGAYYVLGVIDDEIGMYNPKNGEDNTTFINAGHKAYLYLQGASQSTGYRFGFEGTTGIIELNGESGDDIIYDLTGRRVEKAVKGIYIINGKKTLVK